MGFFDYLTGKHDPKDDAEKTGKAPDGKINVKMADPRKSGNVEDLDMDLLNKMNKGRR